MAISSSTSSPNYAAFGKSSPKTKAAQPQFGSEFFSSKGAENVSGNFLDSFARIFSGKEKLPDPNDATKEIEKNIYSTKERAGLGALFSLFSAIIPTASFFTIKGFSTGFGKLWNKVFKSAPKPNFDHAKKPHRY